MSRAVEFVAGFFEPHRSDYLILKGLVLEKIRNEMMGTYEIHCLQPFYFELLSI